MLRYLDIFKRESHTYTLFQKTESEVWRMMSYAPLFRTMKEKGVTSYRLQKMGFNRATYYSIKSGQSVSTNTIERLCKLLQCRVEDVIEYVEDETD